MYVCMYAHTRTTFQSCLFSILITLVENVCGCLFKPNRTVMSDVDVLYLKLIIKIKQT